MLEAGGGDNKRIVDALLTVPLKKRVGEEGRDGGHVMSRSMVNWARMAFKLDQLIYKVRIVIVGKYTGSQDFYLSVIKSLKVREDDFFLFLSFLPSLPKGSNASISAHPAIGTSTKSLSYPPPRTLTHFLPSIRSMHYIM